MPRKARKSATTGRKGKKKTTRSEKIVLEKRMDRNNSDRTALLLKNDIERIMYNLEFRKDMLFEVWSKWRNRKPFLASLKTNYFEIPIQNLTRFSADIINHVNMFYRKVDDLAFYLEFTEDMPTTMQMEFDRMFAQLKKNGEESATLLDKELSK